MQHGGIRLGPIQPHVLTTDNLKSGKGNGQVYWFSKPYGMANLYFKFHVFLPKRFEAT